MVEKGSDPQQDQRLSVLLVELAGVEPASTAARRSFVQL